MKRLRWAIVLPFVLFLQFAYADTVTTFDLVEFTYRFSSDAGGGENASYNFLGAGINFTGISTADCACFSDFILAGTSLVPDVYFVDFESSYGRVIIGGQTYYGPNDASLFFSSITGLSSVTFPAGGNVPSIFTVTVPAAFALVHGGVADGTFFDVNVPAGQIVLTYDYHPAADGAPASYFFSQGHYVGAGLAQVPEPGTISLMVTGLAGVVGLIRRKRES